MNFLFTVPSWHRFRQSVMIQNESYVHPALDDWLQSHEETYIQGKGESKHEITLIKSQIITLKQLF